MSAHTIYKMFEEYLQEDDFVGADMAKKYLHMGFTRARRYANHRSGKKYDELGNVLPQEPDALTCDKAHSAAIFKIHWFDAKDHPVYKDLKERWRKQHNK